MQFDAEFITSITEFLPILIPGFFLVGWFILVLSKHGNLRNMFFWEKLMGRKLEFNDEDFSKAVQEQTEFEQLRVFLPNFNFKSIYHAKAIIKWCRENRIGHNQIKGLNDYFECKNSVVSLKKVNSFLKISSFIIFVLFLATSGASISVALKTKLDHAILAIVKNTHTVVFVYKDRIEGVSVFSDPWVLRKNDKNKSILDDLTVDNIEKLKADLDNGRTVNFVNDNMKMNFYGFAFIAIAFFVYSIPALIYFNKVLRVSNLTKQLEQIEVKQENSSSGQNNAHIKDIAHDNN